MITVTGFVTGDPKVEEGDYGKTCSINLRFKTANGKQTHYLTGKIYGRRIEVAQKYIHDSDQITVSMPISMVSHKQTKKDGTDYFCFYGDISEFSLPAKPSAGQVSAPTRQAFNQADEIDEDEVPF